MMLVSMVLFTASTKAQNGTAATFPVIAGDSLVNADTVFKKISITAGYTSMGVQVSLKKGTGTLDGKFYLYTSLNGNYVLTDSASFTAVPTAALISNSGYTHTAIISKSAPAGTSYLVAATQAGSLTSTPVKVSWTARKDN
ncbi:MAG: hypothetical protein KA954_01250 [Chitinophagales bacterium]|nr:hypothetical protein [Chitinophagales bacterium]MBP9845841.1 hypothetical protein [Saprospiraceae bacterium]